MPLHDAGGLTVEEIALAAQVRGEQTQEFAKLLAWIVYNGAALTGVAVNDPRKFPQLEDAFPSLFERKEQQDWRLMKERMARFAAMRTQSNTAF